MQTELADFIKHTPEGQEAEAILRKCVHCGFCTATCPTYQLLGDELDGPRGRIYLIKQMLEGAEVTAKTRLHLDRCLTCRNCESTCPSGVEYGKLIDIGRHVAEVRVQRTARRSRACGALVVEDGFDVAAVRAGNEGGATRARALACLAQGQGACPAQALVRGPPPATRAGCSRWPVASSRRWGRISTRRRHACSTVWAFS